MLRYLSITVLFIVQLSSIGFAQQIAKSGGTSNSTFLLGNTGYARKSQLLYLPSDLSNTQSGTIIRVYFKHGAGATSNQTLTDFTFKMGQTSEISFTNSTFLTNLTTLVDTPSITLPGGAQGTWFSLQLDSHFVFDASQTLIIETAFQTSTAQGWGTNGTANNPVKKLISPDVNATTGSTTSTTWQDFGFDLAITGIEATIMAGPAFRVFPNPVEDEFAMDLPPDFQAKAVEINIYDGVGKLVLHEQLGLVNNRPVHLASLPPGQYIVTASNGTRCIFTKFVKS